MTKANRDHLPHIGWREWVAFPEFGGVVTKAKVDTGARTSSLHAQHVRVVERDGRRLVEFELHPLQRNSKTTISAVAPFLEFRRVTSSTGHISLRPVVLVTIELMGIAWPIELTLASRDQMGFRMLLGREAVRDRFVIDAGRSYLAGRRSRKSPAATRKRRKRRPS
jgi:hypothetical protein